jgi:hypothetical protein
VIEIFQNRAWLGGLEDDDTIWFSKEQKAGEPVEFTDTFKKNIESSGGRVNAFGVMDDKILAIKRDKVYDTFGDGPNNTDTLGSFAEMQSTTIDVGTTRAKSVVRITGGIMLKSEKGFYGISGSLIAVYIGDGVEDYNSLSVTSATLLSDADEISFTTSDGDLLTYNYHFQRWSTATRLQASDAVLWGLNYVILRTDGKIFKSNSSKFKDEKASYGIKIITGWLAFAGVTGYKRVYRMTFLGDYKSPHKIRVSVGYNFSEAWEHSRVYDHQAAVPVTTYGDDSPYGKDGTVYGGPRSSYIFRIDMKIQKCTSIRFKIEELVTSSTEGTQEGLTISDMGLLIGLKSGSAKLKASQTGGAS